MIRHRLSGLALALTISLSSVVPLAEADDSPAIEIYQQLLADFASSDPKACSAAQTAWQNICFTLGHARYDMLRANACEQMCESLSTQLPRESILFVLRQLELIGREESVPTLQKLVVSDDQVVADSACRALQNNPADAAHIAMVTLLNAATSDRDRLKLLSGLGYRAESNSEPILVSYLEKGEPEVQLAAAHALSRIDSKSAADAVFASWTNASGALADQLVTAAMISANRVAKQSDSTTANSMFLAFYNRSANPAVRSASLKGQLMSAGDQAISLIVKSLNSESLLEQQVAIGHVNELTPETIALLVEQLTEVPPAARASLIYALGANRKKLALPAIEQSLKSDDRGVKIASIIALGHVGSAAHAPLLLDQLTSDEETRSAASRSLATIFDDKIDSLLLERLTKVKDEAKRDELVSILSARNCPEVAQVIVNSNSLVSPDAETRKRATGILNRLGTEMHIPALIMAMSKIPASEQDSTAKTIVNICSRIPSVDSQAAPLVKMYSTAETEHQPLLLSVAGRIGGKAASELISSKIESRSASEKDAAISALCNWPDDSVSDQLLAIAQSGDTAAQRDRAVRAIARVVVLPSSKHSLEEQLSILQQTMKLASQDDERKLILDRAKAISLLSTVEFVRSYIKSATLGQQAESSLVHLARIRELRQADPRLRIDLEGVSKNSPDAKLRERAQQFLLEY